MAMNRVETLERLRQELALRGETVVETAASQHDAASPVEPSADVNAACSGSKPTRSLLLTVPEVCAELRISRAQFYILANKRNAIETVHIGKLCRVPRQALEQYVDSLRSGVSL
jgi:excisionase family DNA binding protein